MASVLKPNAQQASSDSLCNFNTQDLRQEADTLLAEARLQAEEILRAAEEESKAVFEQAKQAALDEAESEIQARIDCEAEKKSQLASQSALASCHAAMQRVCDETAAWTQQWQDETISIALNISRQLLQQELQDESSRRRVLQRWMRTALESLHSPTNLQILVHPNDLLLAEQVLAHIATHLPFANQAELVADESCDLGDCIVHSQLGQVDARLEAQLQRLAEELA